MYQFSLCNHNIFHSFLSSHFIHQPSKVLFIPKRSGKPSTYLDQFSVVQKKDISPSRRITSYDLDIFIFHNILSTHTFWTIYIWESSSTKEIARQNFIEKPIIEFLSVIDT